MTPLSVCFWIIVDCGLKKGFANNADFDCRSSGIKGVYAVVSSPPPVQTNEVDLSHCARFVFLSRAIDETDSTSQVAVSGSAPVLVAHLLMCRLTIDDDEWRPRDIKGVQAGGIAPGSNESDKSQPLRALCFSLSRYHESHWGLPPLSFQFCR